jgi:hypothetical protein
MKKGRKTKEEVAALLTEGNKLTVLVSGKFTSKLELMRQLEIADQATFERHFGELYERSTEFWKSHVAKSFYRTIAKLNPGCVIHGTKTILDLVETRKQEISGPGGQVFNVTITDRVADEDN